MAWYWWYLIAAYAFNGVMAGFYMMGKITDGEEIEDSMFSGLTVLVIFSPVFAPFLFTMFIGALFHAVLNRKKKNPC